MNLSCSANAKGSTSVAGVDNKYAPKAVAGSEAKRNNRSGSERTPQSPVTTTGKSSARPGNFVPVPRPALMAAPYRKLARGQR
jgi:hypothetical protein